jgi:hypothetical protein
MAEVVNSLFGITPESLQARRDEDLQAQALQYAKLNPFERANVGIYTGVSRLGNAIGGMLGAQDPEMMRIRQRQQLLEGADISDPKVLRERAALAMQQNDYPAAQQLATRAMDIEAKQASIAKDVAAAQKETKLSVPARVLQAQAVSELKNAVRILKAQPETPETKAAIQQYEDQLQDLEPAEKTINYGPEAERYAKDMFGKPFSQLNLEQAKEVNKKLQELEATKKSLNFGEQAERYAKDKFGKPFSQLTPEQAREVNKKLEELDLASKKAGKTDIVLPGQQVAQKEWLPFADYLDKNPTIKRTSDLISAAPSALETIRLSTTNDIASTALAPQLARMAGDTGSLSDRDVNRWLKAGGLDDRLIGSATSFFTGKTTVAKKEQAEKYVSAIFRGALLEQKRMLQDKAKEFGYLESPNYKARLQSIDDQLARFKKPSESKPEATGARVQPTGNALIDKYLQPQPAQ